MQADQTIDAKYEVEGHFTLRAVKADGSGSRELASFKNLILDNGFAALLGSTNRSVFSFARVGSGSTPPAAGQSELVSQVASSSQSQGDTVTFATEEPYWIRRTVTKRFAEGVATGNIAEVGIGWAATGNTLVSRALVLDANGNPTTVSVLSDEFLDVTYSMTLYPSLADGVSTLNINGTSHTVTVRALALGSSGSAPASFLDAPITARTVSSSDTRISDTALQPVTGANTGTNTTVSNTLKNYVVGSMYGEVEIQFGLTVGNSANGIRTVNANMQRFHQFQVNFDPPIPKTASQIFRFTLRILLARRNAA